MSRRRPRKWVKAVAARGVVGFWTPGQQPRTTLVLRRSNAMEDAGFLRRASRPPASGLPKPAPLRGFGFSPLRLVAVSAVPWCGALAMLLPCSFGAHQGPSALSREPCRIWLSQWRGNVSIWWGSSSIASVGVLACRQSICSLCRSSC
ncbi:hypothetical protein BRADI_1g67555v3 [Brachypodium distachyon]|uniref:Uncharacterized protein n=1 Tax=Brachypodium distachyon TaxID=15368 RepID=A0A0Q3JYI3_BRADI|nr:hypothetical protein BRADI_1g67555v3 [Brachypodium distachyon]